jgi:hypothetical protein
MEYVYRDWCQFNGFDYKITRYPKETKIPYVSLEKDATEKMNQSKTKSIPQNSKPITTI